MFKVVFTMLMMIKVVFSACTRQSLTPIIYVDPDGIKWGKFLGVIMANN